MWMCALSIDTSLVLARSAGKSFSERLPERPRNLTVLCVAIVVDPAYLPKVQPGLYEALNMFFYFYEKLYNFCLLHNHMSICHILVPVIIYPCT